MGEREVNQWSQSVYDALKAAREDYAQLERLIAVSPEDADQTLASVQTHVERIRPLLDDAEAAVVMQLIDIADIPQVPPMVVRALAELADNYEALSRCASWNQVTQEDLAPLTEIDAYLRDETARAWLASHGS
jgi:hypothetical protein